MKPDTVPEGRKMIIWDDMDIVVLIFLCAFTIIVFLITIIGMAIQTIKRHFRNKKRGEKNAR